MNTYIYGGAPSYSGKYWAMPISPTFAPVWICLPVLICRKICRRAISLFSSQVCMFRIDTRIYRSPSSHRVELSDTSNPVPFSSCLVQAQSITTTWGQAQSLFFSPTSDSSTGCTRVDQSSLRVLGIHIGPECSPSQPSFIYYMLSSTLPTRADSLIANGYLIVGRGLLADN